MAQNPTPDTAPLGDTKTPVRLSDDISRSSKRIRALDGLRGVAVLAVVAFHLARYVEVSSGISQVLADVVRFGWVGVDLFFVLSGFLITGVLYENRHSRNYFRAFYGRRLLRIFPPYYLLLTTCSARVLVTGTSLTGVWTEALPWHVTYLTNVCLTIADDWSVAPLHTGHLWSLAVEEQFYLIWPMVVWTFARTSQPRLMLIGFCVTLVVCSLAFRLWILPTHSLGAYTLLPARIDALATGAVLALWVRGPQGTDRVPRISKFLMILCGVGLLLLMYVTAGTYSYLNPIQQSIGYTLWALFFAGVVAHLVARPQSATTHFLEKDFLAYTGRISYTLYLFHFPILFALDMLGGQALGFWLFAALVLGVSYAVSILSWHLMERPVLKMKSRFAYH